MLHRRLHRRPDRRLRSNWRATGLGGISLALLSAGALAGGLPPAAAHARPAGTGDGRVTVRVVTEVDADGAYDRVLEPGLAGVRVTLTDDAGTVLPGTTGADGTVVFDAASSPLTGGRYRVRVANPDPDNLSEAVAGLGSGPDVIRANVGFVDVRGGTDVTYTTGFWEPDAYCQANPELVTCNLAKGDATGFKGLVSFAGDFSNATPGGTVTDLTDNTAQQSVFGIGVDRTGNTYLGTLVKRHTAYKAAGNTNTIFRYNRGSDAVTPFVTLPGTLTAHNPADNWLHDDAVYGKVGREGIGDVDVSGDGKTLYAVDLDDSSLYAVPLQGAGDAVTAGPATAYPVPRPADCAGDWHPYGIGVRGKRVLVGGVCGAENTVTGTALWGDPSKVTSHVYEFKAGTFTHLFGTAMNYPRGCAYRFLPNPVPNPAPYRCTDATTVGQVMSADWEAWNQRVPGRESHSFVSAPQPILSNIEIADDGDLVLGFRDRFGDMQGTATYAFGAATGSQLVTGIAAGDVLRVCASGTAFTLENNATCGALTGAGKDNELGPGGGEFYQDLTDLSDARHDQITEGGTVLQPYRGKLFSTAYDPFDAYQQGVRRWNSETGVTEGNLLVQQTWNQDAATRADLFGKANGLADLELVCDQAPVQIGNRVWYDSDGNGVQDPSEPPVPGVLVTLVRADGTSVGATTDANGEYYFGTEQGLKPNTSYKLHFDYDGIDPARLPGSPALNELKWTKANVGTDDTVNSKVDSGGHTTARVGDPGHVDHDLDAGLVGPVDRLGDLVWHDTDGDGVQDPGEPGAKDVTVKLVDPATGRVVRTTKTDAAGRYLFDALPDGDYQVCFVRPPGRYLWTRQDAGKSGDDSVVDPATGCSPPVTLGPDHRQDLTLDAGLVKALGLTVAKSDGKTHRPLGGAVFELWQDSNGTPGLQLRGDEKDTRVDDCVSDRDGRCSFGALRIGTYYLVETDVPEGYVLPKKPVTGPYGLTPSNAAQGDGLVVRIANERGEPCKGKC
ncbi:Cna protein B-type domain-containing protein [Streptomyces sp. yr375]|uniref:SdrD B-like domain-containing protein n=1 Tax=Streptomyces sp. yr375 TaxID=1761906 RepID=UPI0008C49176|nr:SdrD B-like domain-containing protein [Streptomyces sp. yr375]SER78593.1 Cna protein B-type domain-containing protein [Streptomyces sp. yr375]